MDRPFLVTLLITFKRVSSLETRSNSCRGGGEILISMDQNRLFLPFEDEGSYQKAVEKLMHKETQDTDDGISQMVDKEHVHHNCFVASRKCALIAHKTGKED